MIRLSYLSAATGRRTVDFRRELIRFGSDASCEVHLPGRPGVEAHHGHLVRRDTKWFVEAQFPVWVNGRSGTRFELAGDERIRVGSPEGPELHLLAPVVEPAATMLESDSSAFGEAEVTEPATPALPPNDAPIDAPNTLSRAIKALDRPSTDLEHVLTRAKEEIDHRRSEALGFSSGHTMMIMAKAIAGVSEKAEVKTRKSRRALVLLSVASAVVVVVLVGVIWAQNRRINTLVAEKAAIDQQIQSTLVAMGNEEDEKRLGELEAHLDQLVGTASDKLLEVKQASERRAEELTEPSDELDQDIRKILHDFHADTYAIPPVFRQALQEQVDLLRKSPGLKDAMARKRQYWPAVQRALHRHQLPSELGYIAFTESSFNPAAVNPSSGAAGLWQLMDEVAKNCGIAVAPEKDERLDPQKSSEAASCYLSKLLIEFGEESFMLALASYNRGENGVRRALHRLAQEPGGFRKRDFWHLYRLKYLPQETREYVPKVLAAAIVLGDARPVARTEQK
jgi:hypothetical protein